MVLDFYNVSATEIVEFTQIMSRARNDEEHVVFANGVIGQTAQGFVYRLEIACVYEDSDTTLFVAGKWSKAWPTEDRAREEMNAALECHKRECAESLGEMPKSGGG